MGLLGIGTGVAVMRFRLQYRTRHWDIGRAVVLGLFTLAGMAGAIVLLVQQW